MTDPVTDPVTEVPGPSVLDSVRALFRRTLGRRQGDPLTVVQTTDSAVLLLGGAGLALLFVAARHRLQG